MLFTLLFHLKRLFSSSSVFVTRVVSSAYLKLLIFLPTILIPACDSYSLAFHMVCSEYKLNKQDDNTQPCHSPFPIWNQAMSGSNCCFLNCIQVSRRQIRWSCIPSSIRIFHSLLWSTQSKALVLSMKQKLYVSLESPCFLYEPINVGNLISGSSAFSKSSLYIWKSSIHILLKPSLKDFEHYLVSMWNECNYMVVWSFFGTAFL